MLDGTWERERATGVPTADLAPTLGKSGGDCRPAFESMSAVVHSARDHASTNGRPTAPARASSHCGQTTVPAGGRSHEKLEVVQPREDELAREGIKRPRNGRRRSRRSRGRALLEILLECVEP